ncbi:MAG: hypothetical protein HC911_05150 [Chloroflexaceae bacterium]|nr:hypothetical protein [Chloroflexaceae bacterium]
MTLVTAYHWLQAHLRWHTLHGSRLRQYQHQQAQRMIAWAWQHTPGYRRHWQAAGYDLAQAQQAWRQLPVIQRADQLADFAAFNAYGITRSAAAAVAQAAEQPNQIAQSLPHAISAGFSSGTAGAAQRGLFLASPTERAIWAGVILARALPPLPHMLHHARTGYRVALFLRAPNQLYTAASGGMVQVRYAGLAAAQREPAQALAQLVQWQPHAIVAPPSLLVQLAQLPAATHLHPERLVSVAEVLEPHDHALLAARWGVPVQQIYQATEGVLAITCQAGRLHLQADLLAFQLVPVPDADPALGYMQPIITDLWRTTQPMLRFALDDVVQVDPRPCPCRAGMPVLQAVIGRASDLLYLPCREGRGRRVVPVASVRWMVGVGTLSGNDGPERVPLAGVTDYQLEQVQVGQWRVRLGLSPPTDAAALAAAVQARVQQAAVQLGCVPPQVQVLPELGPLTPGVKRRRIIVRAIE